MIIVDTGPLLAHLNKRDDNHERCTALLERHPGPLLITPAVMTEVCYFLQKRCGGRAESLFIQNVADDYYTLAEMPEADVARAAHLANQYLDFPLGFTDASVLALAERLNIREIATLDRRHFHAVQPRHTDHLVLLP